MKKRLIYIHGKGGSYKEAEHYKPLFPEYEVIGFDYQSQTPWEAEVEFSKLFDRYAKGYSEIIIIANSIGAYFAMNALTDKAIQKAYFISPIVNMESLICDMMMCSGVTEKELEEKGTIETEFGESLSFEYLCYVRNHEIKWDVPTAILYGERDNLQSFDTVTAFAEKTGAKLTVMTHGEHWFHTDKQMEFLDNWLKKEQKA